MTTKKEQRFVGVQFTSKYSGYTASKTYCYQDNLETPLKEFDIVIAPSVYGYGLAIVREVGLKKPTFETKEIAEAISSEFLKEELKGERVKAITKKLESEVKKLNEAEKFRAYIDKSPEIAALVKELDELSGN